MKELIKINGTKEVNGMRFHEVEGGFGENKKSMLVKEIAHIHGRELGKINELINNNKLRFKDGIDILDLKGGQFDIFLKDNGIYTQNALNVSKNIYLLSERGYAKLLKLLEDDVAWEQYEKLVDGYFNMRKVVRESSNSKLDTADVICRLISDIPDSDKTETMLKLVDRFYPVENSNAVQIKYEPESNKPKLNYDLFKKVLNDCYEKAYIDNKVHKGVEYVVIDKKIIEREFYSMGINTKELNRFIRKNKPCVKAQIRHGEENKNKWEYFCKKELFG